MPADRAAAHRRAMNKREWELVWFMEADAAAPAVDANLRFAQLTGGTNDVEVLRRKVADELYVLQAGGFIP